MIIYIKSSLINWLNYNFDKCSSIYIPANLGSWRQFQEPYLVTYAITFLSSSSVQVPFLIPLLSQDGVLTIFNCDKQSKLELWMVWVCYLVFVFLFLVLSFGMVCKRVRVIMIVSVSDQSLIYMLHAFTFKTCFMFGSIYLNPVNKRFCWLPKNNGLYILCFFLAFTLHY